MRFLNWLTNANKETRNSLICRKISDFSEDELKGIPEDEIKEYIYQQNELTKEDRESYIYFLKKNPNFDDEEGFLSWQDIRYNPKLTLGAEYPQFLKENPNYIDKKELFIEWVFEKHGIMLDYDWYDENYDMDEDDDMSEEDYKNQYISMQENDEEFDKKNKGKIQCVECGEFKEPDIIKVVD